MCLRTASIQRQEGWGEREWGAPAGHCEGLGLCCDTLEMPKRERDGDLIYILKAWLWLLCPRVDCQEPGWKQVSVAATPTSAQAWTPGVRKPVEPGEGSSSPPAQGSHLGALLAKFQGSAATTKGQENRNLIQEGRANGFFLQNFLGYFICIQN